MELLNCSGDFDYTDWGTIEEIDLSISMGDINKIGFCQELFLMKSQVKY